jgi:hypothetical protein
MMKFHLRHEILNGYCESFGFPSKQDFPFVPWISSLGKRMVNSNSGCTRLAGEASPSKSGTTDVKNRERPLAVAR